MHVFFSYWESFPAIYKVFALRSTKYINSLNAIAFTTMSFIFSQYEAIISINRKDSED